MRSRPYLVFFLGPVVAYVCALLLIGLFVVEPSRLGWIGFGVAALVGIVVGSAASYLYPRSRTNPARHRPPHDGRPRLLVVADTHCESRSLCDAVKMELAGRELEVLVLAPVLASPLHFLTNAEEGEREDARARLTEVLQSLERAGIPARGTLGGDDPLLAIGDALAGFPATDVLLLESGDGHRSWVEHGLERKVRAVYGIHVSTATAATSEAHVRV